MDVHHHYICNSKKKTLKYTSICKWIDELWYPCQEILLRKKKSELVIDAPSWNNVKTMMMVKEGKIKKGTV